MGTARRTGASAAVAVLVTVLLVLGGAAPAVAATTLAPSGDDPELEPLEAEYDDDLALLRAAALDAQLQGAEELAALEARLAGVTETLAEAHQRLENPNTPAITHSLSAWPCPSGISMSGCHRSNWANSPGRYDVRPAGSGGRNAGRSSRTRAVNTVMPRSQPTRSAITAAGIRGSACNSRRMSGSNASTTEPRGRRS